MVQGETDGVRKKVRTASVRFVSGLRSPFSQIGLFLTQCLTGVMNSPD